MKANKLRILKLYAKKSNLMFDINLTIEPFTKHNQNIDKNKTDK